MNKLSFIFYSGMENIGFLNVSEESFKEFVKVLHPKYRGNVLNMYMHRKDDLYMKPVITDADTPLTDAQRFFLQTQSEYDHIMKQLSKQDRKLAQVTKIYNVLTL